MDCTQAFLALILIINSIVSGTVSEWTSVEFLKEAGQTFNLKFHKYNPRIRPPQQQVRVTANVTLRHVRDLDPVRGELQTVLDVDLAWFDERLVWHAKYVHAIFVNLSEIWAPDVVYVNSVRPSESLFPHKVRIRKEGDEANPNVLWKRKELVTTSCFPTPPYTRCNISLAFMSRLASGIDEAADRTFVNDSRFKIADDIMPGRWEVSDETPQEVNVTISDSDTLDFVVTLIEHEEKAGSTRAARPRYTTSGSAKSGRLHGHGNAGSRVHSNSLLSSAVAMVMLFCCQGALLLIFR